MGFFTRKGGYRPSRKEKRKHKEKMAVLGIRKKPVTAANAVPLGGEVDKRRGGKRREEEKGAAIERGIAMDPDSFEIRDPRDKPRETGVNGHHHHRAVAEFDFTRRCED
jgi:hypothetical protein